MLRLNDRYRCLPAGCQVVFVLLLLCVSLMKLPAWAVQPAGQVVGCLDSAVEGPRGVASLWDASTERIPDPRKFIIVPSAVANLQADGCFALQVHPGSYYVGAILRNTPGATMGPPRQGDRVFMTPAPDGSALRVDVAASAVIDVGLRTDGWLYSGFSSEVETGVTGKVLDTEGLPVAGLLVFAFADAEMSGAPLAVSERSTLEGEFLLRLDRPGEVYLRVKEDYGGGAPSPGGYVGVYGGASARPVNVQIGAVNDNLAIVVMRVPAEMVKKRLKPNAPQ